MPRIANAESLAFPPPKRLAESPLKLLFDENLSARLVVVLVDVFPESAHVSAHGLLGASDRLVWECAASQGFVLVTKDEDFQRLSVYLGAPPKVIWIRLGNCATTDVARLLRMRVADIDAFAAHEESAFLALG